MDEAILRIYRPAVRYHGGKFRLAPWIIRHFPDHVTYVEPFGGGASVMLRKEQSTNEIYNDLDGEVVNFFQVLRSDPDELIRLLSLTAYSRAELDLAFQPCLDPLERARRFYVRAWQARGKSTAQWRSGWRFQKNNKRSRNPVQDWNRLDHLWSIVARLKDVFIENSDALECIQRYDAPKTLFYIDPPYPLNTVGLRWSHKAYAHDFCDEQHVELAQILQGIQGMALVSGYRCSLLDGLYAGWTADSVMSRTDNAQQPRREYLWVSPNCEAKRSQLKLWNER